MREHKCKGLLEVNQDKESNCKFQIIYSNPETTSIFPDIAERLRKTHQIRYLWLLLNNNDDYYSPAYINFCPFCGIDLRKIKPNQLYQAD